jgi:tetratricopeptide (TPR) repeat protein
MEVLLRERFPKEKFEVINLGITAINSHVILPIARDCAARGDGDVWLIYMGNNEMVGPFGAATVFGSRAPPLGAVRFNLALQRTRVGQLAVSGMRNLGGKPKNTSWGGMQMFLENQIPPDDSRRETVYKNFTGNLRDIVRSGLGTRAKIVLSTMSVNLRDCPPFGSLSNSNLPAAELVRFGELLAKARNLETNGHGIEAGRLLEQAVQIDPRFAEAQFRWAECLMRQSNAVAAREHFQLACDNDALPFRADTRINQAIRELAAQRAGPELLLCDAEAALAQAGAAGIAGGESFFEHVHFSFAGNYRLGRLWAEHVVNVLKLPTNSAPPWLAQSACEDSLGLTDWNRLFVIHAVIRRLNNPPLSRQFNNAARLHQAQAEEERLSRNNAEPGAAQRAGDILNAAIRRAPEDVFLYEGAANALEATAHEDQAIAAYREQIKRMPHDFYANLQIGRLLGERGKPAEGQPYLETAIRLRPSLPEGWHELGAVLIAQEKYSVALECTSRALAMRPQDPANACFHGKVLAKLKRRTEAIEQFRRAIELKPDLWEARFALAGELAWDNQVDASVREYQEVIRLNPRHATSHVNLGVMLARQNRIAEAIEHFEEALRIDPGYKEAGEYLAKTRGHQPRVP